MKDYLGYQGTVCVVTGASSGMGKATAEILVDLGAEVYGLDCNEATIPEMKSFIKVNLAEKSSIDKAFEKIPKEIDKYFGIAGISGLTQDFNLTFTVNFIANKYITEEYLKNRVRPNGAIAYMSSNGGRGWERPENMEELKEIVKCKGGWEGTVEILNSYGFAGTSGRRAYAFSKRCLNYYVAILVPVFGEKNIRVNSVLPGPTKTGLTDDFAVMQGGLDKMIQNQAGSAQRLAESREMAEPIIYLNSDMASYISGEFLNVDYGCNAASLIDPQNTFTPPKLLSK